MFLLFFTLLTGPSFDYQGSLFNPVSIKVGGDGTIYVVDSSEHSLVALDAYGKVIRTIGRQGQGPGEFNNPTDLGILENGNLVVADSGNGRLQLLNGEGGYIKSFKIAEHSLGYVLVLANGHFLLTESNGWSFSFTMGGPVREKSRFYEYDIEGKLVRHFGTFLDDENPLLAGRINNGPVGISGKAIVFASGVTNDLIHYSDGHEKAGLYPLPFVPETPSAKMVAIPDGEATTFRMESKMDRTCAGLAVLANGHYLLLRARTHTLSGEEPPLELIEIQPDGKLVKKHAETFFSKGMALSPNGKYVYILHEGDDWTIIRKEV